MPHNRVVDSGQFPGSRKKVSVIEGFVSGRKSPVRLLHQRHMPRVFVVTLFVCVCSCECKYSCKCVCGCSVCALRQEGNLGCCSSLLSGAGQVAYHDWLGSPRDPPDAASLVLGWQVHNSV